MHVTLKPGTDDERILEDIAAVVHDGDGWVRLCREGTHDEQVLDPDEKWVVIARG